MIPFTHIKESACLFLTSFNSNDSVLANPKKFMDRYAPKNSTDRFDFVMARVVNPFIKIGRTTFPDFHGILIQTAKNLPNNGRISRNG